MSKGGKNEIWADVQNENLINYSYVKTATWDRGHWVAVLSWAGGAKGGGGSERVRCRGRWRRESDGAKEELQENWSLSIAGEIVGGGWTWYQHGVLLPTVFIAHTLRLHEFLGQISF